MEIKALKQLLIDNKIDMNRVLQYGELEDEQEKILEDNGVSFKMVAWPPSRPEETAHWVFKFGDVLYETIGYNDSYETTIDDPMDFYEVEPYEKIVICYRKKSNESL